MAECSCTTGVVPQQVWGLCLQRAKRAKPCPNPAHLQAAPVQLQPDSDITIPAGTADKKPLSESWQPSHSALPDANCQLETNSVLSFFPRGLKHVVEQTFPPSLPLATLGSASCPTGAGPGVSEVPWLFPFLTLFSAPCGAKHMVTVWHLLSIQAWNMPGRAEPGCWCQTVFMSECRGDKKIKDSFHQDKKQPQRGTWN